MAELDKEELCNKNYVRENHKKGRDHAGLAVYLKKQGIASLLLNAFGYSLWICD